MEWRFNDTRYYKLAQMINSGRKLNITQLSKETGFAISHLSRVFDWWQECGEIERIKEGHETCIAFTEFGKEVFKAWEKFAQLANKAIQNRKITQ